MVDGYITAYPSTVKSQRHFCSHLPDFLSQTTPFSRYPILAELAAFERTRRRAFNAKDSDICQLDNLQKIAPHDWPNIRFDFHASARLFSQEFNAIESWQAINAQKKPEPAHQLQQSHCWLVWRNAQHLTEFYHF